MPLIIFSASSGRISSNCGSSFCLPHHDCRDSRIAVIPPKRAVLALDSPAQSATALIQSVCNNRIRPGGRPAPWVIQGVDSVAAMWAALPALAGHLPRRNLAASSIRRRPQSFPDGGDSLKKTSRFLYSATGFLFSQSSHPPFHLENHT